MNFLGLDFEVLLGDYTEIENLIAEGHVDCGFTRLPAPLGFEASSLRETIIWLYFLKNIRLRYMKWLLLPHYARNRLYCLRKERRDI